LCHNEVDLLMIERCRVYSRRAEWWLSAEKGATPLLCRALHAIIHLLAYCHDTNIPSHCDTGLNTSSDFDFIVLGEINFHPFTPFLCPSYTISPLYLADTSLSSPFTPRPFTSTYISNSCCKEKNRTIIGFKNCGCYGRSTSHYVRYLCSYCTGRVRRCGLRVPLRTHNTEYGKEIHKRDARKLSQ
jgi:hypothetical protein